MPAPKRWHASWLIDRPLPMTVNRSQTFSMTHKPCSYSSMLLLEGQLADLSTKGDFAGVSLLLSQGVNPASKSSNSRPLALAASRGHLSCVSILIPVSDAQSDGSLALRLAAQNGHAACVELLIPVSNSKFNGSLALRLAATNGHAECVRLLIPSSDPSSDDSEALFMAAEHGRADCVRLLIPVSNPLEGNSLALRSAIASNHIECVVAFHDLAPHSFNRMNLPEVANECSWMGRDSLASLLMSIHESRLISSTILMGQAPSPARSLRL